jgi:hypothetical protein
LLPNHLVAGGERAMRGILGAVLAELRAVLLHLVEVDDRRIVLAGGE